MLQLQSHPEVAPQAAVRGVTADGLVTRLL